MDNVNVENSLYVQQGQKHKKQPKLLTIFGVGGGACNVINSITKGYNNANSDNFVFFGTDQQSVDRSEVKKKIQLGEGMGAGADHLVGGKLAQDNIDLINMVIQDNLANVFFVVICSGGGTGSGAGPVIIEAIKNTTDAIVVAVVTIPFTCEGADRAKISADCVNQVQDLADSYVLIENDRVFDVMDRNRLFTNAFDRINRWLANSLFALQQTVESPSFMNIDRADVRTIFTNGKRSFMFCLISENEKIDINLNKAMQDPLCSSSNIKKWRAKNALIYIEGNQLTTHIIHSVLPFINKNCLIKGKGKANCKIIVGYNPNHSFYVIKRAWVSSLQIKQYTDIHSYKQDDDLLLVPCQELDNRSETNNTLHQEQANTNNNIYNQTGNINSANVNQQLYSRFNSINNNIPIQNYPSLEQIKQSGWVKIFIVLSVVEPTNDKQIQSEIIENEQTDKIIDQAIEVDEPQSANCSISNKDIQSNPINHHGRIIY